MALRPEPMPVRVVMLATPLTLLPYSPYAAALLRDLDAAAPAFIVLGGSVPRERFVALRRLLAAAYERDRRLTVGKVEIWRRREPPDEPAP